MMTRLLQGVILLALTSLCPITSEAQGLGDLPPVTKTTKPKSPTPTPPPRPRITPTPRPKATPRTAANVKPTPTPPVSYRRDPATISPISFNQATAGNLDPQHSGRITATDYYDEYKLNAGSADLFTIQLQTADPALTVQIYDSNQSGQPILKDPQNSEFRLATPTGTLPGDGEYRVRVLGVIADPKASAVPYTLNIKRTGLTEEGYMLRLEQIVKAFNSSGGQNADDTILKIEELIAADPNKPKGYETLGVAYLYHRKDLTKAVSTMEKAIRLGGAAMFKVAHDSQWRKPERKGEILEFPDLRTSWLYIRPDQATLIDTTDPQRIYFSGGVKQFKEINRVGGSALITVRQNGRGTKPFLLLPVTRNAAEAEVIINMIKSYVLKQK
jgi:hypothetical protein